MAQNILLVDWEFISNDSRWRSGFPVHGHLVKKWLDTGKYEDKTMDLYNNMRASSMFSTLPSASPMRWLIEMFRWFYFKQKDYLGVDQYGEGLEDVYSSDPGLVEYLYNEYYQYFLNNSTFVINDQIQRLIDRKPDDWELGIVSSGITKEEIELIFSDKFCSAKECGEAFTYKFCTDSPIRIYESATTPGSIQFISENIDIYNFASESDMYILSNTEFKKYLHSSSVDVIEAKTVDDFEFDKPGQILVEKNSLEDSEYSTNGLRTYKAKTKDKPNKVDKQTLQEMEDDLIDSFKNDPSLDEVIQSIYPEYKKNNSSFLFYIFRLIWIASFILPFFYLSIQWAVISIMSIALIYPFLSELVYRPLSFLANTDTKTDILSGVSEAVVTLLSIYFGSYYIQIPDNFIYIICVLYLSNQLGRVYRNPNTPIEYREFVELLGWSVIIMPYVFYIIFV